MLVKCSSVLVDKTKVYVNKCKQLYFSNNLYHSFYEFYYKRKFLDVGNSKEAK